MSLFAHHSSFSKALGSLFAQRFLPKTGREAYTQGGIPRVVERQVHRVVYPGCTREAYREVHPGCTRETERHTGRYTQGVKEA